MHGRRGESLPSWKRTVVCHSIGSEWYHFWTDTPLRDTCTPYVHEGNEDCTQAHQLSWQCWDERTSSSDSPPAWTGQSPSSSHVRGSSQLLGHFPCNHIHPTHTHICSSHQCVNLINIMKEQSFQEDYIQLWLCAIAQHYSVCHPLLRMDNLQDINMLEQDNESSKYNSCMKVLHLIWRAFTATGTLPHTKVNLFRRSNHFKTITQIWMLFLCHFL